MSYLGYEVRTDESGRSEIVPGQGRGRRPPANQVYGIGEPWAFCIGVLTGFLLGLVIAAVGFPIMEALP